MSVDVDYRHARNMGTVTRYPLSVVRYQLPVTRIGQRATGTGNGRQKTGNGPLAVAQFLTLNIDIELRRNRFRRS